MAVTNQEVIVSPTAQSSFSSVREFFANLGQMISAAFDAFLKAANKFFTSAGDFFASVGRWIVSAVNAVVKAVSEFFARIFNSSSNTNPAQQSIFANSYEAYSNKVEASYPGM